jgi:hypothetical protein
LAALFCKWLYFLFSYYSSEDVPGCSGTNAYANSYTYANSRTNTNTNRGCNANPNS